MTPPKPKPGEDKKLKQGKEQKFSLETPEGAVLTFGSALEARAERKRRGGTLRF